MELNEKAPNRTYLKFSLVGRTATTGVNKIIVMESQDGGMFTVTEGAVGPTGSFFRVGSNKAKTWRKPMSEWEDTYQRYAKDNLHYQLEETEKRAVIKISGGYREIEDVGVRQIVDRLIAISRTHFENTFSIPVQDMSDERIERAKLFLDIMAQPSKGSIKIFNDAYLNLCRAMPRRIDNIYKILAKTPEDMVRIYTAELDQYENTIKYVHAARQQLNASYYGHTFLEEHGISMRCVTDKEEIAAIKKHLGNEGGRFINAWRVVNDNCEKAFWEGCKNAGFEEKEGLFVTGGGVNYMFHGSRSENWMSILTSGVSNKREVPPGTTLCGTMFGPGGYYAPDACKTMGYTDRAGSRWANGTSSSGFLGIFKIATGTEEKNQIYHPACSDSSLTWDKLQVIKKGAYCTWANRGGQIGLRMDETIVYQNWQSTPMYLVEIGL